jgi:hypothetical protein
LVAATVTGCRPPDEITTGPDGLRTFAWDPNHLCTLARAINPVSGVLAGDPADRERLWFVGPGASEPRLSVVWPQGFHIAFEPDAVLYNEKDSPVAREGDTVTLPQVNLSEHSGTYADPYRAHGIIFDSCYPA